jgi:shikimate kinase
MPLTLIGFRGTGKSSVGPELAARLGWSCVDADDEIVRQAGKSIADIFAQDGEPTFRRYEAGVLAELLRRHRIVVSAGGGAVMDEDTRRQMRAAGPVVWLQASMATIFARIGDDLKTGGTRPALTGHDPRTEAELLLSRREPAYADTATIIVDTDGRSVAGVVDEIVRQLPPGWEDQA